MTVPHNMFLSHLSRARSIQTAALFFIVFLSLCKLSLRAEENAENQKTPVTPTEEANENAPPQQETLPPLAENGIPVGLSYFLFKDRPQMADRFLRVMVYRPEKWTPNDKILIVMHGMTRNAQRYLNDWTAAAEKQNWLAIAPEFNETSYPGSTAYNLGYMFGTSLIADTDIINWKKLTKKLRQASEQNELTRQGRIWCYLPDSAKDAIPTEEDTCPLAIDCKTVILRGLNTLLQSDAFFNEAVYHDIRLPKRVHDAFIAGPDSVTIGMLWQLNRQVLATVWPDVIRTGNLRRQPVSRWTFTVLETIFDEVRRRTQAKEKNYLLYGHSAGGQFVHRMAMFYPAARFKYAVVANAGRFTLPEFDEPFPYGLAGVPYSKRRLMKVLAKPGSILVGENDTGSQLLSVTPRAMEQGENRRQRAEVFYKAIQSSAKKNGVPLGWELLTVKDAGHYNAQMVDAAVDAFNRFLQQKTNR